MDAETRFLHHLAHQVFGEGAAGFHPAAGGTPEIRPPTRIGVDQQQAVFVQDQRAGGKAGACFGQGNAAPFAAVDGMMVLATGRLRPQGVPPASRNSRAISSNATREFSWTRLMVSVVE